MADVTNISGRINSISQEGVAVVASQTLDERKNKKQSVINQETDEALANHGQHIGTLEEAVGAGGSVDERIAQAKSEAESDIKGGASSDYDTLKKTEDAIKAEVNAREEADSSLDGRMRTLEDDSVRYTPQTPSQTEQAQARTNLDTYSKAEVNQIASAFTEQNYVTVQAVAATTAADIPTLINATGDGEQTDTLYRVGWFDGTAFDVTKYSLYTWNGTAYVQMAVRSSIGEVFDISEYNATGGTPAQYETLALALGTDGANVPEGVRQGGMSVKFIQGTVSSTDNKYVQYRLMADEFSTNKGDWEQAASMKDYTNILSQIKCQSVEMQDYNAAQYRAYIYGDFKQGGKVTFSATGTAVTNTSSIQIRLDDVSTEVAYLTNNSGSRTITLNRDTAFFCALITKSNITTSGTIIINVTTGVKEQADENTKHIEELLQANENLSAEILSINTRLGDKLEGQVIGYNATQKRAYIYGDFKSGDLLRLSAYGTAVTNSDRILVRLDDASTEIATLTNNGTAKEVVLSRDTSSIIFVVPKSDITTDGTITASISTGFNYRIEELDKQMTLVNENKKIVIQRRGVSIIGTTSFSHSGYINQYDSIIEHGTYHYSDYISVFENSTYSYNGSLSGNACILAYTENKRVIKVWHSTDSISSLVMPYNTRFIRISTTNVSVTLKPTTNLRRESDIVTSAYHATSENSVIVKSGNEIHINNNDLCNRWRLFCKFKLNGYIEGAGELKICELSGNDTYEVGIDGQPNSLMPITANGITSVYPIPKRNSRYYGRKNSLTRQQTGELSLPAYNEVIGKDLFTIQYVGVASSYDYDVDNANVQSAYEVLSDKLFLSLVNNTLSVYTEETNYINLDLSNFTNIGQIVDYINANYSDYKAELIAESTVTIDKIAPITKVALVSQYPSVSAGVSTTRYDAFKCYFNEKEDETIHTLELISDYGYIYTKIDGLSVGVDCPFIGGISDLYIGLNGENNSVSITDYNLVINSIEECGLYTDYGSTSNIFWSKNNPRIIVLEAHGVYDGDSCDQLTPIYTDETPDSGESAVIPINMRPIYEAYGVVTDIVTSTKKLDKIFKYAKNQGYEYIKVSDIKKMYNGGKLPAKCYTIIFDDANQYFYDILNIKNVFSENCVSPVLATEYTINAVNNEDYIKKHRNILLDDWEIVMHGLDAVNVGTMSSTQLYDLTSSDLTKHRMMNIQRETAKQILIRWDIWVYSNGSSNPNVIKSFSKDGEILGFMTPYDGGSPIERGKNRFYLSRVNVNEKTSLNSILNQFLK